MFTEVETRRAEDANKANPEVPRPSTRFTENYREYVRLCDRGLKKRTFEEEDELQRLRHELEAEFMSGFGFRPDTGKMSKRFFLRLLNTPFLENRLFDHVTFFRRGGNLVIVSQPYHLSAFELTEWGSNVGASVRIAREWRHYHGAEATLFFVEFTPEAKARLNARLRLFRS